jgi:hypothetical protein
MENLNKHILDLIHIQIQPGNLVSFHNHVIGQYDNGYVVDFKPGLNPRPENSIVTINCNGHIVEKEAKFLKLVN